MYKITAKEQLAPGIFRMLIEAPRVAAKARPGHFVVLRTHEAGERIPLTIVSTTEAGEVEVIFQVMGKTTAYLAGMQVGDGLPTFLGPLGVAPEVPEGPGTVLCVAGGVGAAPILPRAKDYSQRGWKVLTILGARNEDLLILEDRLAEVSSALYISTDDGSKGHKGFVTDLIPELAQKEEISEVLAIGPVPMMAAVTKVTRKLALPTTVSLNALMVDGTGMCGACRVSVGGETKFTCVDGPEFDGHQVDFAQLRQRLVQYLEEEKLALDRYKKEGECQCLNG
ncbi:MAG: sulfide/dihydroorotate dehydrogenase-like FAD/NAD-binding protein [Firmicutes bacterium]|nr:sulfide/dihydroorotate dehydrogenase-like FAD/NAD-binding protein [Bacillota bacterium]